MPAKLNLIGQKFGRLTVIEQAPNRGKRTQWKCKCDCGEECIKLTESLRSGTTQSCGCLKRETLIKNNKNRIISLEGQRFGMLTVIKQAESYREHSAWVCQCECGNIVTVNSTELKRNDTLSCGCLRSSFGEKSIEKLLRENNINYKKEYAFQDLVSINNVLLRFDFAIFDENNEIERLIEYDGEQHYLDKTNKFWKRDSLEERQKRDKIKNQYCQTNHIKLIRIPYWEKNNITIEMLFSDQYLI